MAEVSRHNTDGRVARGQRTRRAILDAHTALLREGVLKPTGKLITERAGISVRTLWLNFKDLEALMAASTTYWLAADLELRVAVDPGLPLSRRIDDFCAQRVVRLEHLAPAARSAELGEPFSAALQASRHAHVQRGTDELEVVFGRELGAAAAGHDALLMALFAATSWPTWKTLRDDFGLDTDRAAETMRATVTALLRT